MIYHQASFTMMDKKIETGFINTKGEHYSNSNHFYNYQVVPKDYLRPLFYKSEYR